MKRLPEIGLATVRATARVLAPVLLVGSMLLAFVSLQAAASRAVSTPLRVGVSPIFPPMVFKQGKQLAGVEVDLARALGEHLGRPVEFVEVPWKDQIEALNERRIDIVMSSMSITQARKYLVSFTRPYLVVGQMGLVRREDKSEYALGYPYRLKGTVGVIRATTGEFLVQRDFPTAKHKPYDNGNDGARALLRKNIDLFIADSTLVYYLGARHANDGLAVVPIALSEEQLAWAVRKTDDALLASANEFISQARQDGRLAKVYRLWTAIGD